MFLTKVLHILYNNCLYDISVKGKGHNNFILVVWLVKNINNLHIWLYVVYILHTDCLRCVFMSTIVSDF